MRLSNENSSIEPKRRCTFTVFTPTYNRANLLPRLYGCLKDQTFKDFEWLIVDDGSTDNTAEIVRTWQREAAFPIRYLAQPNSGKHVAVNRGAREAAGRFFATQDSDDWYVPQALERFFHHWNSIPAALQPGFVGVVGLCAYPTGEVIGSRFPQDVFDSDPIDLRYRYKVKGDKNGVLRSDIMRQFPYPEDIGKFIGDSIVWNRMARSYKTRFVNEALTIKEYQPGGLSDTGRLTHIQNSRASLLSSKELVALGKRIPLLVRARAYANCIRYSLHERIPFGQQASQADSKAMFCLCYPLGFYLQLKDQRFLRKNAKL